MPGHGKHTAPGSIPPAFKNQTDIYSTPNVHWIAPIIAGIPFGAGNCGVFIYASNYLVHSYGIYAASALAGNAVLRSAIGGSLPLAGPAM